MMELNFCNSCITTIKITGFFIARDSDIASPMFVGINASSPEYFKATRSQSYIANQYLSNFLYTLKSVLLSHLLLQQSLDNIKQPGLKC